MIQYPLFFEVSVKSTPGVGTPFEAGAENFPRIAGSIPKEFNGPGSGYSPEDLFALSVASCLIATFKVFAEKSQLAFGEITTQGKLTIDRGSSGMPEFKKLELTFNLNGVEDQEKAKKILGEAEKYCLVSNAVKTEKTFTYNFT